jgi:nucleotide-binding universal stress UspA family protein
MLSPWIIGVDLGPRGAGALVFATWLRRTSGTPVFGLHLIAVNRRFATGMDAEANVRAEVSAQLDRLGLPPLDRLDVAAAEHVEQGLLAALERAEGLVVGRAANSDDRGRLGPVTRRVLRELTAPVVVVPPELTEVGAGPVLLATDLGPASAAAARWAAAFADEHERPLAAIHVAAASDEPILDPSPLAGADGARAVGALDVWLGQHGLTDRPRRVAVGDPVEQVAAAAAEQGAALVVVGSRRLTATPRLFAASTSAALAARCGCPVAVVAPG